MEFDAAAPAPATEGVTPPVAPIETDDAQDTGDDAAMGEIYDRLMAEPEAPEAQDAAEPKPETVEAEPAETADPAEVAPSDLPLAIKTAWATLPKEARDAVTASHREMSQRLAEQGRMVQGIAPIRDVLVDAAKTSPALMNMTPQQVAVEIMQLAKVSNDLSAKPVETVLGVIERYGIGQAVAQALSGAPATQEARIVPALQSQIRALEQQLQRVADPEYLRAQVAQVSAQERAMGDLTNFSAKADHWGEIEQYIPDVIPVVQKQLGPSASMQDVLKRSYELALSIYLPDAKASTPPAPLAQATVDPKKAEAVLKAKSVNVTSRPGGNGRVLSEDEVLSAAYDRIHNK